jgi:(S)-2-hydroxyglutarate dehydrogenase
MRFGADRRYDVTVVGGGLIGLATAYRLLEAKPGLRLAVLEKEPELARHQSGHNSGVIHAGLYYTPGSLKARLCREGMEALKRFADERGIPYELCGKLVVALDESELSALAELKRRGLANGLRGLQEIDAKAIHELEPHATGIRALHVPETGIIDFAASHPPMPTKCVRAAARSCLGAASSASRAAGTAAEASPSSGAARFTPRTSSPAQDCTPTASQR